YSDLINKLPPSLVNEAWKRNPIIKDEASDRKRSQLMGILKPPFPKILIKMSIETVPDSGYYSISNVSVQSSITTATDDTVSIQKMPDYTYFRSLWWTEGNIHPEAKWEEA
ncbi:20195_t:CDS:2, partial [Dentiscutata erythropus]